MKFFERIINWLAVTVISLTVTAFVLDATLLNVKFTNQAAKQSGFFDGLAGSLPKLMAGGLTGQEKTDTELILSSVLTPSYIAQQWEIISTGWDRHYRNREPMPKINLVDIENKAVEAGFTLPESTSQQFKRPPALEEIPFLAGLYTMVRYLKLFGILLSLLALAAVWFIAGNGRFMALAKVFIGVVIGLGTTYVILLATPGLIAGSLSSNQDLKTLADPLGKFLQAIFSATNQQLLPVMVGFVVAAGVCLVLNIVNKIIIRKGGGGIGGTTRPIQKFHPPDKE